MRDAGVTSAWFKQAMARALFNVYALADADGCHIGHDVDKKVIKFWFFQVPCLACRALEFIGTESIAGLDDIRERLRRSAAVMAPKVAAYARHEIPGYRGLNLIFEDAANLHAVGRLFGNDDWRRAGASAKERALQRQDPEGFFPERERPDKGPSAKYHQFSLHTVTQILEEFPDDDIARQYARGMDWYLKFMYPTVHPIEICDERERYVRKHEFPGLALFSDGGRAAWRRMLELGAELEPTALAEAFLFKAWMERKNPRFLQILEENRTWNAGLPEFAYRQANGKSAVATAKPWFMAGHAYLTGPIDPEGMWHRELQQHIALYHEKVGVLFGGGNSLAQPEFSTLRTERSHLCEAASVRDCDPRNLAVDLRNDGWSVIAHMRSIDAARAEITVTVNASGPAPAHVQLPIFCSEQRRQLRVANRAVADFSAAPAAGECSEIIVACEGADVRIAATRPFTYRWPAIPVNVRAPGRKPMELSDAVCPLTFALPKSGSVRIEIQII